MRELVYDIIENGKVIETTPILSKAKASGNYRSQSCRHTPRRFEIESARRAHVRLGAFFDYITQVAHLSRAKLHKNNACSRPKFVLDS